MSGLCCLQAGIFASAGVDKIRLTGGEPTLRRDLVELTAALRALPGMSAVGLTTNGLTLSRKLSALQAAGLPQLAPLLPAHLMSSLHVMSHLQSCKGQLGAASPLFRIVGL